MRDLVVIMYLGGQDAIRASRSFRDDSAIGKAIARWHQPGSKVGRAMAEPKEESNEGKGDAVMGKLLRIRYDLKIKEQREEFARRVAAMIRRPGFFDSEGARKMGAWFAGCRKHYLEHLMPSKKRRRTPRRSTRERR